MTHEGVEGEQCQTHREAARTERRTVSESGTPAAARPTETGGPPPAWPKPQGPLDSPTGPQPEGLCGIMSQAPVGSAFKILIQSILVTET